MTLIVSSVWCDMEIIVGPSLNGQLGVLQQTRLQLGTTVPHDEFSFALDDFQNIRNWIQAAGNLLMLK